MTASVEVPVATTVSKLGQDDLRLIPSATVDRALKQIPGFQLFRRTTSLVAHPTTQGVSLRGIGSTAASRTLVLVDGVPVNDPFGGWIQWTSFIPEELTEVEVMRGSPVATFGYTTLGGLVHLRTSKPERATLATSYMAGNTGTHLASLRAAGVKNQWWMSLSARGHESKGFPIIHPSFRGPVDRNAQADFLTGRGRIGLTGSRHQAVLSLASFAEARENGTILQRNSTTVHRLAGIYSAQFSLTSLLTLTGYHTREEFRSSFSSISIDRSHEQLTLLQSVPSQSTGGSIVWQNSFQGAEVVAGGDYSLRRGVSHETVPFSRARRSPGGEIQNGGLFGQLTGERGRWRFSFGAREELATGGRRFFSPNAGLAFFREPVRFYGSIYRAFRLPTLNELYRQFRVGNVVTLANANLKPEKLFGAEIGIALIRLRHHANVAVYQYRLADLVINQTLEIRQEIVVRQRANTGRATVTGVEAEWLSRWGPLISDLRYLHSRPQLSSGFQIPQVSRHQGSWLLGYTTGRGSFSAVARAYSPAFEDDLNRLKLPGFITVDVQATYFLGEHTRLVAEVENLLNHLVVAGFVPAPLIAEPRLWRVGVSWELSP